MPQFLLILHGLPYGDNTLVRTTRTGEGEENAFSSSGMAGYQHYLFNKGITSDRAGKPSNTGKALYSGVNLLKPLELQLFSQYRLCLLSTAFYIMERK